jgi:hypothetical protein
VISLLLKLKKPAVKRKNTVGNITVHIWNWGLHCGGDDSEQEPQCVLCYEVLSNECMKSANFED